MQLRDARDAERCCEDFQNGTVQIRWDDPDGWPVSSICDLEDLRVLRLSYKPGAARHQLIAAVFRNVPGNAEFPASMSFAVFDPSLRLVLLQETWW